jgi:hypothetical protein
MFVEISDSAGGAFFGKSYGDGTANPAIAAGDQSDLAVQLPAALMRGILRPRPRRHLGFDSRLSLLLLRRLFLTHAKRLPQRVCGNLFVSG